MREVPSALGFASAVPVMEMAPGSIRLDEEDEERAVDIATRATVNTLLMSLVVLFDELAGEIAGEPVMDQMPAGKAEWLRKQLRGTDAEWSAQGVMELVAIRNALVHGGGRWTGRAIEQLRLAGVNELPSAGQDLSPGIDDLFRYRRAVRTALNKIRALSKPPLAIDGPPAGRASNGDPRSSK